jgi:predicted O-methyltransferase YrrM
MKGNAALHALRVLMRMESPNTQTSSSEQEVLKKYVRNALTIAEIGVFEGVNTATFALNSLPEAKIFAIDPFFKGVLGFSYEKMIAQQYWKRMKVRNKIQMIEGLSWDTAHNIPDNLDMVFIDGDHSYEGVKKDFEIFSKKVKAKGYLALHDARVFENGWTTKEWGPVRLVDTIIRQLPDWCIVNETDSLVVIQRR